MGSLNTDTYYQTLGLEATATDEAIKTAYRKLVLRYHPDRSTEADAVNIFTRIQKAYEVLSHPALREAYDRQLELNIEVDDNYHKVSTRFVSRLIDMHVSATQVRAGEPFTVLFRCPRRIEGFKLRGLEHFEVLKSVQHEMPYQGKIITQVHFVLRAMEEGSFRLGPASAIAGSMEYRSGQANIIANGWYKQPTWAQRQWFHKYYPIALILVAVMLPSLIFYNIAVYGIKQPGTVTNERVYPFGQRKQGLATGASPYQSAVLTGQPLNNGQVTITNARETDAVFLLLDDDEVIKYNHYIRAGDQFILKNIADGTYQWMLISGNNWDAQNPAPVAGYRGNFKSGTTIGSASHGQNAWKFKDKETNNTIFYPIYILELSDKTGEQGFNVKMDVGFYILD